MYKYCIVMALLVVSLLVYATAGFAAVTGTVTDTKGAPMAGATVTFTDESNPVNKFSDSTDAQGKYAIDISGTTGIDASTPSAFSLGQNYPNPFNPTTTIPFTLDSSVHVSVTVYNIMGQRVATVIDNYMSAGSHFVTWNGMDDRGNHVSAGVYLYQLSAGRHVETKKMLLLDGGGGSHAAKPTMNSGIQSVAKIAAEATYTITITHSRIIPYQKTGVTITDGQTMDFVATLKIVPIVIQGITLASISAGSFQMGDETGNLGDDCRPVHSVTLSAFEMSVYEITQSQYKAVKGVNPSNFKGDDNLLTDPYQVVPTAHGPWRLLRGGSWINGFDYECQSAYRGYNNPVHGQTNAGFRVVRRAASQNNTTEIEGITLVSIPEGSFQMGDETGNLGDDCRPLHSVTISAFEMGVYEITQGQWKAVTGGNPSYFTGDDNLPVESVSWWDAIQFCNTLSTKAGLQPCYKDNDSSGACDLTQSGFRLPTEAEWEYACRAGSYTRYNLGDAESDLARAGWYSANSGSKTHPVGQKTPNAWGLYDMHGNVAEWCNDWFGDYSSGMPVESVSWWDAIQFCNALSTKAGLQPCYKDNDSSGACDLTKSGFRLPTEAEWEYACRAGSTTKYNLGDTESDLARAGWYSPNSSSLTHPVGQKTPNAWGLYDMHGNVAEWCNDWFGDYSSDNLTDPYQVDPTSHGPWRLLRGGSWSNGFDYECRSAYRGYNNPVHGQTNTGFRVVRRP